MGRDKSVGLFVGLVFIFLFGAILSVRVKAQANEHADFPMGESRGHRMLATNVVRPVDPLVRNHVLEIPAGGGAPGPNEPRRDLSAPKAAGRQPPAGAAREAPSQGLVAALRQAVLDTHERCLEGRAEGGGEPARPEPLSREPDAPRPQRQTYKVRPNDSLIVIARRVYGPQGDRHWRQIYEANKEVLKNPDHLVVGQELVIPPLPTAAAPQPAAPQPAAPQPVRTERDAAPRVTADELARMLGVESDLVEARQGPGPTYTVKAGDSFHSIAAKLYGDEALGRLLYLKNKHLVSDPRRLSVGQRILLLDGVAARAPGGLTGSR